jgi:hypothetical protein
MKIKQSRFQTYIPYRTMMNAGSHNQTLTALCLDFRSLHNVNVTFLHNGLGRHRDENEGRGFRVPCPTSL